MIIPAISYVEHTFEAAFSSLLPSSGKDSSALIFGTPACANQERHRLVRSCLAGKEDKNRH